MTYNAPVTDMKFAMQYIAKFDEILKINKFSDYNFELAETILDEASKIAENVISPLNHSSDKNPAVRNIDGSVLSHFHIDYLCLPHNHHTYSLCH